MSLALSACQTTHVSQQIVDAHPDSSTDEAGLWMIMGREEKKLAQSPMVEHSPELNAYIRSVMCKIAGDYCANLRIYIVNQPVFNANVAPNGAVQVWTGLLLRADNEAQLAFVLGHEFGHYLNRDSLRQIRSAENTTGGAMIFAAATAPFGGGILAALAASTSIYDYSRDLEREADAYGFDAMRRAGYAPSQCADIWRSLSEEVKHSDVADVRKAEARGSIFKTHPLTSERIATLAKMTDGLPVTGGELGEERYRAATAPFFQRWLKDDVHRGDYGESLYLIDRLIQRNQFLGILYFERGEILRLRRQPGDAALAMEAYRQAIAYNDAPAATWRELAEINLKQGMTADARQSFETYLRKNPNAEDRTMIEATLSHI